MSSLETPSGVVVDEPTIVFVGGHWLGRCEREWGEWSCNCDEHYVDIFHCCPECGSKLDKWGDCPDDEEHYV